MDNSKPIHPAFSTKWQGIIQSIKKTKIYLWKGFSKIKSWEIFLNVLTHRSAEEVSDVACLDMISIRALAVSENLFFSTGAGTLENVKHSAVKKKCVYRNKNKRIWCVWAFCCEETRTQMFLPFHDEVKEICHRSLRLCRIHNFQGGHLTKKTQKKKNLRHAYSLTRTLNWIYIFKNN